MPSAQAVSAASVEQENLDSSLGEIVIVGTQIRGANITDSLPVTLIERGKLTRKIAGRVIRPDVRP